MEQYLKQYLPFAIVPSYYRKVAASIQATKGSVTIKTKTSDSKTLYIGICGSALALTAERGVTKVVVVNSRGQVRARSVSPERCAR